MPAAGVTTHREQGFFAGPKGCYRKTSLLAYPFLFPSIILLITKLAVNP